MVAGGSRFPVGKFANKLIEFGISKKQAEELEFHLFEFDIFINGFKPHINKIIKCKFSQKGEMKNLLEDLWGEFEHHVIPMHLVPAKNILDKITDKM